MAAPSPLMAHHQLLDRAEDRAARFVLHLDPDRVAEVQELGLRLAVADGLDGAHLGDAGIAAPALGDRASGPAVRVLVRDRAGADDRAGGERPRLCCVADQGRGVEGHVVAGVRAAEGLAVHGARERQRELGAVPRAAELVRRHRHGREGRRRLALEEAEALAELVRDELRSDTSLTVITSRIAAAASSRDAAISLRITATSPSKSMPLASVVIAIASRGPRNESEPPWYISGSVQNDAGISAPRARRTSSTWFT